MDDAVKIENVPMMSATNTTQILLQIVFFEPALFIPMFLFLSESEAAFASYRKVKRHLPLIGQSSGVCLLSDSQAANEDHD